MSARTTVDRDWRQWPTDVTAALERVRPQLVRSLKAYRIPVPDSEDLMQDAMLALISGWAEIREPGAWLVGTVRHLCRGYVRRQRKSKVVGADLEQLERLAGVEPGGQEQHGARLDLERLVRELTPGQRRLLRLIFGLGLDARELARMYGGAKPASLRQARGRAIRRLRDLMDGERQGRTRDDGGIPSRTLAARKRAEM
jgi:RNA polymerase sigma factor (sigma-70 family)